MKPETIALHGGYGGDPTTKAVAVPIYQTVAYSFDSAAHGAALFDLEVEGYRYTRIGNPTVDVLERRIAELEGGIDALAVASGQTAVYYTMLNLAQAGQNIVSVPQLYGTTHTLFAHILPQLGVKVRLARSDSPAELESLIDADTRALFCETVGNPAGNICDLEARAARTSRSWSTTPSRPRSSAGRSTTAPTSWCTRSPNSSADTARASAGRSSTAAASPGRSTRRATRGSRSRTSPTTGSSTPSTTGRRRFSAAAAASSSGPWARCSRPSTPSCCCRGSRRWRCGSSGTSRTRVASRNSSAPTAASAR